MKQLKQFSLSWQSNASHQGAMSSAPNQIISTSVQPDRLGQAMEGATYPYAISHSAVPWQAQEQASLPERPRMSATLRNS